jgi:hypothetical protein
LDERSHELRNFELETGPAGNRIAADNGLAL